MCGRNTNDSVMDDFTPGWRDSSFGASSRVNRSSSDVRSHSARFDLESAPCESNVFARVKKRVLYSSTIL